MHHLRRLIVTILASTALLVGLLGSSTASAKPAPPPTPDSAPTTASAQGSTPARYRHRPSVTKSQMAGLRIAKKVSQKAVKDKTLDYRKAAKLWGKHTIYRRQFAGAWAAGGGKIKNIGKAERAKVYKYRLKAKARSAKSSVADAQGGGTNCTGDTAYIYLKGHGKNLYFYDSCRTSDFKANLAFCMTGAGFAAAISKSGGVGVVMAILIAGCGASTTWLSKAQNNSRKNAIVIVTQRGYDYSKKRYVAPVEIEPQ